MVISCLITKRLISKNTLQVLTPEEIVVKQALIRQLQTRLRNEEMSLVLLKKIRASQIIYEQTV